MLACTKLIFSPCPCYAQRSEHNEGVLSTLQEIGLHQQGLERIELVGHLCRQLKILYLQGNVICKLENLHRLKVKSCAENPVQNNVASLHLVAL